MAAKTAKSPAKSKTSSGRGGARAGAGRKPRPVEEIRDALNAALISEAVAGVVGVVREITDHATAAMGVLREILDNERVHPKERIAAARELLNRTIGRSREAEKADELGDEAEQIHVYVPDNGRGAM